MQNGDAGSFYKFRTERFAGGEPCSTNGASSKTGKIRSQ